MGLHSKDLVGIRNIEYKIELFKFLIWSRCFKYEIKIFPLIPRLNIKHENYSFDSNYLMQSQA